MIAGINMTQRKRLCQKILKKIFFKRESPAMSFLAKENMPRSEAIKPMMDSKFIIQIYRNLNSFQ